MVKKQRVVLILHNIVFHKRWLGWFYRFFSSMVSTKCIKTSVIKRSEH